MHLPCQKKVYLGIPQGKIFPEYFSILMYNYLYLSHTIPLLNNPRDTTVCHAGGVTTLKCAVQG